MLLFFAYCGLPSSYLPIAHMVWYWAGPDAITDAKTLETVTANAGWLWARARWTLQAALWYTSNAGVAGLVSYLRHRQT